MEDTQILPLKTAEPLQAHSDIMAPPNLCDCTQAPRDEPPHSRPRASRWQLEDGGGTVLEGAGEHETVTKCEEDADVNTPLADWQVTVGRKGVEVGRPGHLDAPAPCDQIARCTPEELQWMTLDHASGWDSLVKNVAEQVLDDRGRVGGEEGLVQMVLV